MLGLAEVQTNRWGGLLVTLVVAVTGILIAFPLGVVLALGRRSRLPVIRILATAFIELWRGVPLVAVLFMASVMLPLFLPSGVTVDKLLRAIVGIGVFYSAYMAEAVRGGLQSIPRGQIEGAMALGLSAFQRTLLIVLPQALTIAIPGIVNTIIALFKDTSLVLIIALYDLLGMIQSATNDSDWAVASVPASGYAVAALIYWTFCFSMSRYSQFIERRRAAGRQR
jgi:general L-amino acid transport system permease protein